MHGVLFARTRHHYQPYDDVFRVAELSGYPTAYLDAVDWQTEQTVIATPHNGEWAGIPHDKRSRLIWWHLERAAQADYSPGGADVPPGVDEVWVSDAAFAARTGAKYVFLGGHRAFAGIVQLNRQWDIVLLMAMFGRRTALNDDLRGFRLADVAGGLWGNERHYRMRRTALLLTAHQDDLWYLEPPRFMLAGCYGLPIITETIAAGGRYRHGEHYLEGHLRALGQLSAALLRDPLRLALMSRAIHDLVCHAHPFIQEVEAAL